VVHRIKEMVTMENWPHLARFSPNDKKDGEVALKTANTGARQNAMGRGTNSLRYWSYKVKIAKPHSGLWDEKEATGIN
jgi:hypothetical protein